MLRAESTVLALIDVQEKLAAVIHEKDRLIANLQKLIQGVRVLELPIIWTEQYPQGLGPTVPELIPLMSGLHPIPKLAFSCCEEKAESSPPAVFTPLPSGTGGMNSSECMTGG